MRIGVLGAGLLGISSAWALAQDGHEVLVLDRQSGAALETSFANGGQLSASHAEPWAHPGVVDQIMRWLLREDAPLLWRFRADADQWMWGLRFLRECGVRRTRANTLAILRLALYSRACLAQWRSALNIHYDEQQRGILHFYSDAREFARAVPQAALISAHGCECTVMDRDQCIAVEPALAETQQTILGGVYAATDESGDAYQFTQALASHCAQHGVQFEYGCDIRAFDLRAGRIEAVRLAEGRQITAEAWVLAAGSESALMLKALGVKTPIIPAKGYSLTIPVRDERYAPQVSLTDDAYKIVFSRLGERLRVAGTAEFTGYDLSANLQRSDVLLTRTRRLFPHLPIDVELIQPWCGLRPATPNNVPLIGKSPFDNLWLNSGHGTLGWTMACGSGQLLADLIAGRAPQVDATAYAWVK